MDMIRIGDNKLKLMLSAADCRRYNISGEDMDCLDPDSRRALRRLLDDAGSRSGFDAAADKIFVQLYPCRSGGCELFVTRLDAGDGVKDDAGRRHTAKTRGESLMISKIRYSGAAASDITDMTDIYEFPDLVSVLSVCSRLRPRAASSVYFGPRGEYYLLIADRPAQRSPDYGAEPGSRVRADAEMICGEYDGRRRSAATALYIKEHCDCVCRDTAIQTLGSLA